MKDLVLEGIHKANEDLKRESEERIQQQGIMRQLPLVGELFNWLAPIESHSAIGRTFNLQSGRIASTEVTYKYHMQVNEDASSSSSSAAKSNGNVPSREQPTTNDDVAPLNLKD